MTIQPLIFKGPNGQTTIFNLGNPNDGNNSAPSSVWAVDVTDPKQPPKATILGPTQAQASAQTTMPASIQDIPVSSLNPTAGLEGMMNLENPCNPWQQGNACSIQNRPVQNENKTEEKGNVENKEEHVEPTNKQRASMAKVAEEFGGLIWEQDKANPNIQRASVIMKDAGIGTSIQVHKDGTIVEIKTDRNKESLAKGTGGGFWNGVIGGTEMLVGGSLAALGAGISLFGFTAPIGIPGAMAGGAMFADGSRRMYNANSENTTYTAKIRKWGEGSKVIEYNNDKDLYGAINAEVNKGKDIKV
jgi:hypothetical protein